MSHPQEFLFSFPKKLRQQMLISGIIFALFTIGTASLPFLPKTILVNKKGYPMKPSVVYFLSSTGFLFFGGLAWSSLHVAKMIPFRTIAMDEDGLWYGHLRKKDALVPWNKIIKIKANKFSKRLRLLDLHGNLLLTVEYQLIDFQKLRAAILSKIQNPILSPQLPISYQKKVFYHILIIGIIIFFFLLGLYAILYSTNPFGYISMAVISPLCLYEYLVTIYKITIDRNHITVHYPWRIKTCSFQDIQSIKLESYRIKSSTHPEVRIWIKSHPTPLKLRYLGVEAFILERVLSNAQNACLEQG